MCVIINKPKNIDIPTKEILQNCWNRNSDGAGYMYCKHNKVIIKKGFMQFEEFYNSIMNDYNAENLKSKNLIMHLRIGTSGGINKEKTHPFEVTSKIKRLDKIYNICDIGAVHNGVLNDYVLKNSYSDTQNYIATFLTPLLKSNIQENLKNKIIKDSLGYSKLTILYKNDKIKFYGDFQEFQGCYYSNDSYKGYTYTPKRYDYSYYNDWYEDFDNYYSKFSKVETQKVTDYKDFEYINLYAKELEKEIEQAQSKEEKEELQTELDLLDNMSYKELTDFENSLQEIYEAELIQSDTKRNK